MTIKQQTMAKFGPGLVNHLPQRRVIRVIIIDDSFPDRRKGQFLPINFLTAGDCSGNRANAGGGAVAGNINIAGQGAIKHIGVKLKGLAVDINKNPGKQRPNQGGAQLHCRGHDLVNIAIFGLPQQGLG